MLLSLLRASTPSTLVCLEEEEGEGEEEEEEFHIVSCWEREEEEFANAGACIQGY